MVELTHIIHYVKDIPKALKFYEEAFALKPKFVHESGQYAEVDTGATALAFASEAAGDFNLPDGYIHNDLDRAPLGCEICLTTPDVQGSYERALDKGGTAVAAPTEKPWGQTVAYVRDPNGVLVEIASPITPT